MRYLKSVFMVAAGALGLVLEADSALGQTTTITFFGRNGELVCTNLPPSSTASVVWSSSVLGPWTNACTGLDAVVVNSNGTIRVNVPTITGGGPVFYRVRGTAPATNTVPAGMVSIPAGSFVMGDAFGDWPKSMGTNIELPDHTVYVSAFYMDKYEVTKALWDEVRDWANAHGYDLGTAGLGKAPNHPVNSVNWYQAVKWCNARSEKEGLVPAYYTDSSHSTVYRTGVEALVSECVIWGSGYRLPTEAEWEKAARGGLEAKRYSWGDTINQTQANYQAHPLADGGYAYDVNPTTGFHPTFVGDWPYTSPVGYFDPNGYGLYDMVGNVLEWTWDRYALYELGAQTDPRGPPPSPDYKYRMTRGGSWLTVALTCRTSYRPVANPADAGGTQGFRTVLAPGQQ